MLSLDESVAILNAYHRRARRLELLLLFLQAVTLILLMISVWSITSPGETSAHLALGTAVAVAAVIALFPRPKRHRITLNNLALSLEFKDKGTTPQALDTSHPSREIPELWRTAIAAELVGMRRFERRRLLILAGSLVAPATLSLITIPQAAPTIELAISGVQRAVSQLTRGAQMRVLLGSTDEKQATALSMSGSKPIAMELISPNLIEVTFSGAAGQESAPTLELRRPPQAAPGQTGDEEGHGGDRKPTLFQSFQMAPVQDEANAETVSRHVIAFAVTEDVEVYIPALSASPLAQLKVRQPPIPKVKLTATETIEDPWPDDQTLPLRIQVKAEHPLDVVRLLIKSGSRVSKELVANVVAEDKLELRTDYRLILEPYVETDMAQVEIVAEAVDKAVPTPLVGHSEPLRLNTASAYGRYRQALQTLRELKQLVDDAVGKQQAKLPQEAAEITARATRQSERSPFFDGLDRVQISRFQTKVSEQQQAPEFERLLELSSTLNDFLFEHEILDDRERDRDFFVAARGLSRIVEQDAAHRPVPLKTVTDRIRRFLDDRHERWSKRVARIDDAHKPQRWPEIREKKPFRRTLDQIERLEDESARKPDVRPNQLTELSKSVVDYRTWIEELESAEDKAREDEDKKRQEGLANARDRLRELQKRQGEVSSSLDHAENRQQNDLDAEWPTTRMKQNANEKETHRLEGELRSLSATAAARIKAAVEAMQGVGESGNEGRYVVAESNSDLAGRLLRQADSAAQQSQQKRKSRGRRRRVTGDNYYGQSVIGGDVEIKREYQVDRRYREDILDEVQGSGVGEENRTLLETYLRQVVR